MKKLRVTVEGKEYEVLVEVLEDDEQPIAAPSLAAPRPTLAPAARPAPVARPAMAATPAGGGGAGAVTAPMAGLVVKINVAEGARVTKGDTVLVLEAMKMNSDIPAPVSGVIKEIKVKPGDPVSAGQAMIVLEAESVQ